MKSGQITVDSDDHPTLYIYLQCKLMLVKILQDYILFYNIVDVLSDLHDLLSVDGTELCRFCGSKCVYVFAAIGHVSQMRHLIRR